MSDYRLPWVFVGVVLLNKIGLDAPEDLVGEWTLNELCVLPVDGLLLLWCLPLEQIQGVSQDIIKRGWISWHRSCKKGQIIVHQYKNTYLKWDRLGVIGDPSLIWPNCKLFWPLTLHVSMRFLGGSVVSTVLILNIASVSSSNAGRLLFLSSSKK